MKKITVDMIRKQKEPEGKELKELIESMKSYVESEKYEKDMRKIGSPQEFLNNNISEEDACLLMSAIGIAIMQVVKATCTPAAWKLICSDLIEKFKE